MLVLSLNNYNKVICRPNPDLSQYFLAIDSPHYWWELPRKSEFWHSNYVHVSNKEKNSFSGNACISGFSKNCSRNVLRLLYNILVS